MKTLADLKLGESGTIKSFDNEGIALKLIEMGCLPGEVLRVYSIAPFGDPIAVEVAGYILSMRREEAANVYLEESISPN